MTMALLVRTKKRLKPTPKNRPLLVRIRVRVRVTNNTSNL
jgi:hypothetical protein